MDLNDTLLDAVSYSFDILEKNSAWLGHLPFASWIIKIINPKIFVELGTHWGHSYFSFCRAVKESNLKTFCYAIDNWKGEEQAGFYTEEVFEFVNEHNKKYSQFSHLLRLNFDEAVCKFEDNSINILHIDGLHKYEAVKHDFETWLPKLSEGAIVLFHDIKETAPGFEVWKYWNELKSIYDNNFEFLHSHGLGVLQIPCKKILII
jgi:hypothetical protein